jgi:RES domain-containing protein
VRLWRISEFLELDGEGGRLFGGRWNRGGLAVVYAAESSALSMLELLVQYRRKRIAEPFQLLEISAPDGPMVEFEGEVPDFASHRSQSWGETWLESCSSLLARVPAAVAPSSYNILINPAHPDASKVHVVSHARYIWDSRLFAEASY